MVRFHTLFLLTNSDLCWKNLYSCYSQKCFGEYNKSYICACIIV